MDEISNKDKDYITNYKDELIVILHKSQERFEKQLSYISAGSLVLSMAFIKDIVKNIANSEYRGLLICGWFLLGITLIINCISHIRAVDLHNKTIREINNDKYDNIKVSRRYREITCVNWLTVITLALGICLIIIFSSINIYNG